MRVRLFVEANLPDGVHHNLLALLTASGMEFMPHAKDADLVLILYTHDDASRIRKNIRKDRMYARGHEKKMVISEIPNADLITAEYVIDVVGEMKLRVA